MDDGLVYETTRVVVQSGLPQTVHLRESKPREEITPIHVVDVSRMTLALRPIPGNDSVGSAY